MEISVPSLCLLQDHNYSAIIFKAFKSKQLKKSPSTLSENNNFDANISSSDVKDDLIKTNNLKEKCIQSDLKCITFVSNSTLPQCPTDDCTLLMTVDNECTSSDLNVTTTVKKENANANSMTLNKAAESYYRSMKKYHNIFDRYSWDWSEKIELKNGHLVYMIFKTWRDSVRFENENCSSILEQKTAWQCVNEVAKKIVEYLPQNIYSIKSKLKHLLAKSRVGGSLSGKRLKFFEKQAYTVQKKLIAKSLPPENAEPQTPKTPVVIFSRSIKEYYDYLDRYSWHWSEKIELKNGHLVYMIYKIRRDSLRFYQENAERNSNLKPKSLKQCIFELTKKFEEYLPEYSKSVGMKLRRVISASMSHKGCITSQNVEFYETKFIIVTKKSKPKSLPSENAELQTSANLPECSKCAFKQNDRKSLLNLINEMQAKLKATRKTVRDIKKQYTAKRVNQQFKRKNIIIAKRKRDRKELKAKHFQLRQENRRLKIQNEHLMEDLKRKNLIQSMGLVP